MAYDRQASAARNLAAAGVARDSSLSPYTQWRRLGAGVRDSAKMVRAAADPKYHAGGRSARVIARNRPAPGFRSARAATAPDGSSSVYATNKRDVITALWNAQKAGHTVAIRANFLTPEGQPRTRVIEGVPGVMDLGRIGEQVDKGTLAGFGDGATPLPLDMHVAAASRGRPGGAAGGIEILSSPGRRPGGYIGLDPLMVLAVIRAAGGEPGVWDAIYAFWLAVYGI